MAIKDELLDQLMEGRAPHPGFAHDFFLLSNGKSSLNAPVQAAVADGFAQVAELDVLFRVQVCDGSGDL